MNQLYLLYMKYGCEIQFAPIILLISAPLVQLHLMALKSFLSQDLRSNSRHNNDINTVNAKTREFSNGDSKCYTFIKLDTCDANPTPRILLLRIQNVCSSLLKFIIFFHIKFGDKNPETVYKICDRYNLYKSFNQHCDATKEIFV